MTTEATTSPEILRGVTQRPETNADEAFLREVYAGTREIEMALAPWDAAQKEAFLRQQFDAQRMHYRRYYPDALYNLVLQEGQTVGRIYLDRTADPWTLLEIALLPQYRNAGLGTALMRGLLADAQAAGASVQLHVETFNPARRLYERLGFAPIRMDGVHILMNWSPLP